MKFQIEYEIPPLRAIYRTEIEADTEEKAKGQFRLNHPRGKIRKINGFRIKGVEGK